MSDTEKPDDQDEPKLVVDTDWKEQVAREKEQAAAKNMQADKEEEQPAAENEPADSGEPASADLQDANDPGGDTIREAVEESSADPMPAPPPATFDVLISMLFTQAMSMLGQMPDPASGKVTVNKPYAKHFIETLEMLGEKTTGNLSDDEKKMLGEALHALRMMYVNAKAK